MKYILRLFALPFWLVIGLIGLVHSLIQRSILFVRYGGECITYQIDDRATIKDIYNELKENKK